MKLNQDQKDEPTEWLATDAGKKKKREYIEARDKGSSGDKSELKNEGEPNNAKWKKQLRKRMKTPKGMVVLSQHYLLFFNFELWYFAYCGIFAFCILTFRHLGI